MAIAYWKNQSMFYIEVLYYIISTSGTQNSSYLTYAILYQELTDDPDDLWSWAQEREGEDNQKKMKTFL